MKWATVTFALAAATLACCDAWCGTEPPRPDFSAIGAILAPKPGNKACYVRSYDAAHLRAHPKQRITAMKFLLAVEAYPEPSHKEQPEDLYYYTFAMSVARRHDKRLLHTAGDCLAYEGIHCVVDCDGGAVELDKMPPAGSLIVRISDDGIRMFHDCDEEEDVLVTPGQDDKAFRSKRPRSRPAGRWSRKKTSAPTE